MHSNLLYFNMINLTLLTSQNFKMHSKHELLRYNI
jgi:hypothetical protein